MKKLNKWILRKKVSIVTVFVLLQILLLLFIYIIDKDIILKKLWFDSSLTSFFAGFAAILFYPFYFIYSKILGYEKLAKIINGLFLIEFYIYFLSIFNFIFIVINDNYELISFFFIPGFMITLIIYSKINSIFISKYNK